MPKEHLEIVYDEIEKIWRSKHSTDFSCSTIGKEFLEAMRGMERCKVLEYHFEVDKEKTAKQIYCESINVATNLQRLKLQPAEVVVFISGYNYYTSALTFGCLLSGLVVNFFEVQLENDDFDRTLANLEPSMILYEDCYEFKLKASLGRTRPKLLKHVLSIDDPTQMARELLRAIPASNPNEYETVAIANPQLQEAFLVLTSGSTGLPKTVKLSHSQLLNGMHIWWDNAFGYEPLNADTSILFSLSPLRWISQVILLLQSALLGVKRICSQAASSGSYGLEILQQTQPTHLFAVPSFFYDILRAVPNDDAGSLKSLKLISLGGETPMQAIIDLSRKLASNARLFWSYGMSEMASAITNDEEISGGKLLPGYQIQILDENHKALGTGQHGQIAIKSPYTFLGYKDVDYSKYILKTGFFVNGDYGYFDEQKTLHFLARYKDLVKADDVILIPNIIETLCLKLPEILITRCVGCPAKTSQTIEKSQQLPQEFAVLFVVLQPKLADTVQPKQIRNRLHQLWQTELHQKEIEQIKQIHFVDQLPLTTCGKIDRVKLKEIAKHKNKI